MGYSSLGIGLPIVYGRLHVLSRSHTLGDLKFVMHFHIVARLHQARSLIPSVVIGIFFAILALETPRDSNPPIFMNRSGLVRDVLRE